MKNKIYIIIENIQVFLKNLTGKPDYVKILFVPLVFIILIGCKLYKNVMQFIGYLYFILAYDILIFIIWIIRKSFDKFSNVPKEEPIFNTLFFVSDQYLLESAEKLLRWTIGNKLQIYLFEPFLLPFANYLDNFLLNNFIKTIENYLEHLNIFQNLIDVLWLFIKSFKV